MTNGHHCGCTSPAASRRAVSVAEGLDQQSASPHAAWHRRGGFIAVRHCHTGPPRLGRTAVSDFSLHVTNLFILLVSIAEPRHVAAPAHHGSPYPRLPGSGILFASTI